MRITVYLPDGQDFEVVGIWIGFSLTRHGHLPVIRIQKAFRVPGGPFVGTGRHFAGNPLAVFKDVATGEVLYNPRTPKIYEQLHADLRRWIEDHPGWFEDLVNERTGGDQCQR